MESSDKLFSQKSFATLHVSMLKLKLTQCGNKFLSNVNLPLDVLSLEMLLLDQSEKKLSF